MAPGAIPRAARMDPAGTKRGHASEPDGFATRYCNATRVSPSRDINAAFGSSPADLRFLDRSVDNLRADWFLSTLVFRV